MVLVVFRCLLVVVFFFKQKTAYEMRISDWSSDVCSSDLLSPDQRVGVGWYKGACLACEWCLKGEEQHCAAVLPTCSNGQKGGFADFLTCDSRFVFLLPDNLPSHVAAPLFCAGQTVFTALLRGTRPGMRDRKSVV